MHFSSSCNIGRNSLTFATLWFPLPEKTDFRVCTVQPLETVVIIIDGPFRAAGLLYSAPPYSTHSSRRNVTSVPTDDNKQEGAHINHMDT